MLLVKTKILPSKIHGLGLFVDEDIPKGTKIWEWTEGVDQRLTESFVESLPDVSKEYIKIYAWLGSDGFYYLCGDNDRFANHSENPTCSSKLVSIQWLDVAERDIRNTYNLLAISF